MSITKALFGKTKNNETIDIFTLSNSNGVSVQVINYGATIVSIKTPDKDGNLGDIVFGYDNVSSYEDCDKYIGATLGRCANRIKNGKFTLEDVEYSLATNNHPNHLHGGIKGFNKVVWQASIDEAKELLELSYLSKDGEEGYPGNLKVTITYTLSEDNSFKINYKAVTDKTTIVNLSNHSYFNLTANPNISPLNHELVINADSFTEIDDTFAPNGKLIDVAKTPMDFKKSKAVINDIKSDFPQLVLANGYDHNFVLNSKGDINVLAAKLTEETTGRSLEVYTTMPCMQFYSSNFLDGTNIGKNGFHYEQRAALCFETQYAPNAINLPSFTSPILKKGEEYNQSTIFKFSTL
ncbi:aldose epimerase family protein [Clostridium felsineum]|uniref:Aldose 1-epimerase n=1 Tax=Clostridium felsineum TaxID=36839 RepID=A0A1S8MH36_9CLOT|nr:aldose epimerase family protein [Clostridium felsineum]URZ08055.1 Aldose 1-epimerase [Clostridium felsineum]URZ13086.1 Aldose 1-epimerase [Clostridium felsineum]